MRKIVFQMMLSVDGYYEAPGHSIDWHEVDDEMNRYSADFLDTLDGLLFGRRTYDLMASYWPTPQALADDPQITKRMNALPKFVASRTMTFAAWENSEVLTGNVAEEVRRLKQHHGRDIAIVGSSELATSLIPHGLIDEYRLMISPIALGEGTPVLRGLKERLSLALISARTFSSGMILLTYEPLQTEKITLP